MKKYLLKTYHCEKCNQYRQTLYVCDICNKKYKSQSGLERHWKIHTRPTPDDIVDITLLMEDTSIENSQPQINSRFEWGKYKEAVKSIL